MAQPRDFRVSQRPGYRCIRVAEKDTAANSDEDPAESLENGLAFEVVLQLLPCTPVLTVAFHGETPFPTLDHEINPRRSDNEIVLEAATHPYSSLRWEAMGDRLYQDGFCDHALTCQNGSRLREIIDQVAYTLRLSCTTRSAVSAAAAC